MGAERPPGERVRGSSPPAPAFAPLGRALADWNAGDTGHPVVAHRDDGGRQSMPAATFFRGESDFSAIEQTALTLSGSRVLDAGAGAGCHSLALIADGRSVRAIDVVPEAVDVMRARGISDARAADLFDHHPTEPFDTVLMLMNGLGLVGALADLPRLFDALERLVAPSGSALVDSIDLRRSREPSVLAGVLSREVSGRYAGDVRFHLEYRGSRGAEYPWLFADPWTLERAAAARGWHASVVCEEDEGRYLARLIRSAG